jgi:hypothetical protein
MARSKNNIATHGLSGRVDWFVFKQWFGQTIVAKRPALNDQEPSEPVKLLRLKFKEAIRYAKAAIADAMNKQYYESKAEPGQSGFNMACADYYTVPEIGEIDTSGYNGSIGSRIGVPVAEVFKVASVQVKISREDGTLVEEGAAIKQDDDLHWEYTATVANASLNGDVITVTASDMAGNSIAKSKTM